MDEEIGADVESLASTAIVDAEATGGTGVIVVIGVIGGTGGSSLTAARTADANDASIQSADGVGPAGHEGTAGTAQWNRRPKKRWRESSRSFATTARNSPNASQNTPRKTAAASSK